MTSDGLSSGNSVDVIGGLCERRDVNKILSCPVCDRPLSAELSMELSARQSKAGHARWHRVGKRARSEQMKAVRRGEKKIPNGS